MGKKMLVALVPLLLGGCAVQKEWVPIGGSRADGTVKLAYEYGALTVPTVDNARALQLAKQRCAAWGYTNAEPFEGVVQNCTNRDRYGCNAYRVTATYQCIGKPSGSR